MSPIVAAKAIFHWFAVSLWLCVQFFEHQALLMLRRRVEI